MTMMMPSSELVVIEASLKRSGLWENNSINTTSRRLKRSKKNLRMPIKMFTKLLHLSLPKKTQSIKKLEVKFLKQRKWGLNSERELLRELLKKEEQPWSVKRQLWKKGKKKERKSRNRLETRSKLRAKLSNCTAKLKSFRDRNFLLRMPDKKWLKRLGSSRLTLSSHREQKQLLKKSSQESKNVGNGWRSTEMKCLSFKSSREKLNSRSNKLRLKEDKSSRNHVLTQRWDLTLATLTVFVSSRFTDSCTILDKIIVFQESKGKLFLAEVV